jgi:hypothetical protein
MTWREYAANWRLRRQIYDKTHLRWWLVYGATRSGTSYMTELIEACSSLWASDWGLGVFLAGLQEWLELRSLPIHEYITFDAERLLRDLSWNILDNAYRGRGTDLDLVYKEAALKPEEYLLLTRMWGAPERVIFCLREPAGYMASAIRKFPLATLETLQASYVEALQCYLKVGGDIFAYSADHSLADYVEFLAPLDLARRELPAFLYTGTQAPEETSAEMWRAYHQVKDRAYG